MARLTSVEIKEVSAVDRPANKRKLLVIKAADESFVKRVAEEGGKFCLYDDNGKKLGTYNSRAEAESAWRNMNKAAIVEAFMKVLKSDGEEPMDFNEVYLLERLDEVSNAMFEMCYALRGSIMSILTQGGGAEMVDESVSQFAATMSSTIKSWLAGEVAQKGDNSMLTKEQIAKISDPAIRKAAEEQMEELTALKSEVETLKAEREKSAKAIEELQKKADETDPEAIWKGTNPQLRKMFEAQSAELAEQKRVNKRATYVAKAGRLGHVPQVGTDDEWVALLEKIDESLPREVVEKLDAIFASVSELMKSGRLSVVKGSDSSAPASVIEKINARAHEIAKSEGVTSYKVADYYGKVFAERPEWHEEYNQSANIRVGRAA